MENKKLKLSDVEWKEFPISELFEIVDGYYNKKPPEEKGDFPFLGATQYHNGITSFYKKDTILKYDKVGDISNKHIENRVFEGNCIAITNNGSVGNAYYQKVDFTCSHDVTPIYLKERILNRSLALFMIPLLTNSGKNFEYAKKWRPKRMRHSKIMLPIDINENPNWQFMEDYMKQHENELLQKVQKYYTEKLLTNLIATGNLKNTEWKEFEIGEICEIKSGVRLTKNDMEEGKTPFVGATDSNNGITEFVGNSNQSLDENVLGVNYNGSVVENFYHPYECIFSDDVKRLHLKEIPNDKYVFLFLKTSILAQKQKFQYGYKFNAERMSRQKFLLPINSKGEIDYDFMKKFMMNYEKKSLETVLEYYNITGKPHFVERERERERERVTLNQLVWREFEVQEISEILSGQDIYEKERVAGKVPYITSTALNNGIGYFISNQNPTLESNCISVNRNGSVGYAFYHKYNALFSNDTRRLRIENQSEYSLLFVANQISKQKEKFGYGYKMGTGRLKKQKILLPVDKSDSPDWNYMDVFMRNVESEKVYL